MGALDIMRRRPLLRWPLALVLAVLALLALAGRLPIFAQTSNDDQGVLAGFISRVLSTPTSRVTIGAIDGALSSDATIREISVADDAGTYLTIDRIRLVWQRTALLQRRIAIQRLEIGEVRLMRRPQSVAGNPEPGPILPDLPLSVEVGAFTLASLTLGEPVLGAAAQLAASGSASLGAPAQGLRAAFAIRRLDAAGNAELSLAFVPEGEGLVLSLNLAEPEGGLAARLAGVPGLPPVRLDLNGAGTLDDWQARLSFEGGPEIGATGLAGIRREGVERILRLDLESRIAPLLPSVLAPVFGGATTLNGAVAFADGGAVSIRDWRLASSLAELRIAGSVAADQTLDLTARARALPNQGNAATIGQGRLERLAFEGRVMGAFAAPQVSGRLDLAGLSTPDVSVALVQARFSAIPLPASPGSSARIRLDATANAAGLVPADAGLAEAIGREVSLVVRGEIDALRRARLEVARLASPHMALDFAGLLGPDRVDGQLTAEIMRLAAFSRLAGRSLQGRMRIAATLLGSPATPDITARLSGEATGLRLASAPAERVLGERLALAGQVRLIGEKLEFDRVSLSGDAVQAQLQGQASASVLGLDATLELSDLGRLDANLRGRTRADLRLEGPTADPDLRLRWNAADVLALGRPISGLALDLAVRRSRSAPDITATASGSVDRKPLTLDLRVLAGEGVGLARRPWRVERFVGRLGSIAVNGAGTLDRAGIASGQWSLKAGELDDLSPLLLRKLGGTLDIGILAQADARPDMKVTATGAAIRVDALQIARFRAEATLMESLFAPRGPFSIDIDGLSMVATRTQGLPPLALTARGRLDGDAAQIEASLRGAPGITLTASGTVPLSPGGRLDLKAQGTLDAALANARLVGPTQRLAGRLALDLAMGGTLAAPDLRGNVSLSGGSFTDAAQGIALTGIVGRARGSGNAIVIEQLTARTRGEGTLSLTGRIEADGDRGFPAELRVTGRNAELVNSGLARLVANLDLAASGSMLTAPQLRGRIDVVSLDIRVPERLGGASAPLRDARHIAPPPQTRARLAQNARASARTGGGGVPFRASLDLAINAPGRIFVRGRGLDAELGGSLRLTGNTSEIIANGAFDLRRGRLSLLSQRLDFSRGRLSFAGSGLIPELDFLAETRAAEVTARIAVTGPANAPEFAFSSSPSLPEDEVLSRLLFARAAAGLSPFQAIQLAQAVAQLSGAGGGDTFEGIRRALGVDDIDIALGEGAPTVGLSRAISNRARINVRTGARSEDTSAGVDIDLTRRLRLRSEIGADGNTSVGIAIEQEY